MFLVNSVLLDITWVEMLKSQKDSAGLLGGLSSTQNYGKSCVYSSISTDHGNSFSDCTFRHKAM
eukprot:m.157065 g.157065  ORF g.157065 m.157065 type:complete len:64 (+) comp38698_c0_seq1:601-792(+)